MKIDKVILYVHGIVETNKQFLDFINYFSDYEAKVITLPGHDSTALNFGRHGLKDWREELKKTIDELFLAGKTIYAIGHSMGGLLLLDFINHNPSYISKLVCLALPLKIKPRFRSMVNSVRIAFKLHSNKNEKLLRQKEYYAIKPTRNIFAYYRFPLRYLDLFHLSHLARKNIGNIKTPMLIINSLNDEMVSPKINKYLNTQITYKVYTKSGHTIYDDLERKAILEQVREFLAKE